MNVLAKLGEGSEIVKKKSFEVAILCWKGGKDGKFADCTKPLAAFDYSTEVVVYANKDVTVNFDFGWVYKEGGIFVQDWSKLTNLKTQQPFNYKKL